jgi:hypothetical protein
LCCDKFEHYFVTQNLCLHYFENFIDRIMSYIIKYHDRDE